MQHPEPKDPVPPAADLPPDWALADPTRTTPAGARDDEFDVMDPAQDPAAADSGWRPAAAEGAVVFGDDSLVGDDGKSEPLEVVATPGDEVVLVPSDPSLTDAADAAVVVVSPGADEDRTAEGYEGPTDDLLLRDAAVAQAPAADAPSLTAEPVEQTPAFGVESLELSDAPEPAPVPEDAPRVAVAGWDTTETTDAPVTNVDARPADVAEWETTDTTGAPVTIVDAPPADAAEPVIGRRPAFDDEIPEPIVVGEALDTPAALRADAEPETTQAVEVPPEAVLVAPAAAAAVAARPVDDVVATPAARRGAAPDLTDDRGDGAHDVHAGGGSPARREFLKKSLAVLAGGAVVGVPAAAGLVVFLDPLRKAGGDAAGFIEVAKVDALPQENFPYKVRVVSDRVDAWTTVRDVPIGAVYLVRNGSSVTAFNVVCPHAGCFVDPDPKSGGFSCPCHRSFFRIDGSLVPGSVSPRPLDRLDVDPTALANGVVRVKFQNFRPGTADKVAVG